MEAKAYINILEEQEYWIYYRDEGCATKESQNSEAEVRWIKMFIDPMAAFEWQ